MKIWLLFMTMTSLALTYPVCAEDSGKNCYPITKKDLTHRNAPRFDKYPAKAETIKKPKVNLKSHPDARTYRTVLRRGVAEGPNFAGHYSVVGWGCGTSCVQFAVVDVKSGKVIFPDEFTGVMGLHFDADDFEKEGYGPFWGLRYKIDSRLLVVVGMLDEDEKREGAFYYVLEKGKLKRLYDVRVKKDDCDDRVKD